MTDTAGDMPASVISGAVLPVGLFVIYKAVVLKTRRDSFPVGITSIVRPKHPQFRTCSRSLFAINV